MGEPVISGNPVSSKPKKKNHKKKNSKPKESFDSSHQVSFESNFHIDDNFDDWQSQSKAKKPRAKMNGESLNGSSASASVNGAPTISVSAPISQKLKKSNNGPEQQEKKDIKTTVIKTVNKEKVGPPLEPTSAQQQDQREPVKLMTPAEETPVPSQLVPVASLAKQQTKRTSQNNLAAPVTKDTSSLFAYIRHLEHSLAIGCDSATVEAVRSAHPNLTFSHPVPDSLSSSSQIPDISENPTKSEIVNFKALLLAKQSEVIFYKNLLENQRQQALKLPYIEEKKSVSMKKPKEVASKCTQCENVEAPQQVLSPTPHFSTQATIEKSLLDQILLLSDESTRFKQRCDIANRDVEVLKKECARLEAECKKIRNKTAKETKELVKKESDALVKKLQDEIVEKDTQIIAKSAQNDALHAQLESLQATVSHLKQSEQASMNRLVELEVSVKNLIAEKETMLLEKDELTKTAEKVTSEMSWFKQKFTEKENELVQTKGECSHLLTELEATKLKLETVSLAHQVAEKEICTGGETIEHLKGKITTLELDLSAKEEELSLARYEIAANRAEFDQIKEDLAQKSSELVSAQKELVEIGESKDQEVVLEIDVPAECHNCFVLEEANSELKTALAKTREELLCIQRSLEKENKQ
nr:microtubule associated protein [Hymenolepis microstoma]